MVDVIAALDFLVVFLCRFFFFIYKFVGERCELPIERLLSSVRETFSNQLNPNVWSQVMGGSVSSLCGILNSGRSLHFYDVSLFSVCECISFS